MTKAEDASLLDDEIEVEIEQTMAGLRSRLRRFSRTARAFAFLRGDA